MKKLILCLAFALSLLNISAAVPQGYYNSLDGKADGQLKTAIWQLVHKFTLISSYQDLPKYFQKTDVYPNSKRWWDMYSDIPLYAPSFSGLNREHSFPKSWWGGSTTVSAYVDLNHLYPSEASANMAKSNWPLGVVDRSKKMVFENGITTVGVPMPGQGGGAKSVFEPADEYKGDFARTYFYMATCYQDLTWSYTYMVSQNLYPTLNPWAVNLLMEWHRQDPVSQKEIMRNEEVYKVQSNRNPFIDMPELAEYLWGQKKGQPFTPGSVIVPVGDPILTAPTSGMELEFGQVAEGKTASARLFVQGKNITGSVSNFIYGDDASYFTASTDKIPAELACSEDGYWLTVNYKPTKLGLHTANMLFEWGAGSRVVVLRGECLEAPVLTACTALPATNITADSYTANWTAPAGEVIDYFEVTRTRYIGGEPMVEVLLAEDNYLEITDFGGSDSESYSVQSVRLGSKSPMSNVIFVERSGVTGVGNFEPLTVYGFDGMVRFVCSAPQADCRIYDATGRLVLAIPEIAPNDEAILNPGVYFVTTAVHPQPIKLVVR